MYERVAKGVKIFRAPNGASKSLKIIELGFVFAAKRRFFSPKSEKVMKNVPLVRGTFATRGGVFHRNPTDSPPLSSSGSPGALIRPFLRVMYRNTTLLL